MSVQFYFHITVLSQADAGGIDQVYNGLFLLIKHHIGSYWHPSVISVHTSKMKCTCLMELQLSRVFLAHEAYCPQIWIGTKDRLCNLGHRTSQHLSIRCLPTSWRPFKASSIGSSETKLNKNEEMGRSCWTPLIVSNKLDGPPCTLTQPYLFEYNEQEGFNNISGYYSNE